MALSAYSTGDRVALELDGSVWTATVLTPNDLAQHAEAGFDARLDDGRYVYVHDTAVIRTLPEGVSLFGVQISRGG